MTRNEHLAWAKERAYEYINLGELDNAFASFSSDLTKHPDLPSLLSIQNTLGAQQLIAGFLNTPQAMRSWIEGFN